MVMAHDRPSRELESREPTVEDLRDLCRSSLSTLPDNAVRELQPSELQKYNVIRVGDEILVDLMRSAGGIDYAEAAKDVVVREVDGVPIPFASPRLLWRMKVVTHREKDADDLAFLRHWFAERGEEPPRL